MTPWFQGGCLVPSICSKLPHFPEWCFILYENCKTAVILWGSVVMWFIGLCLVWSCTEARAVCYPTKHMPFPFPHYYPVLLIFAGWKNNTIAIGSLPVEYGCFDPPGLGEGSIIHNPFLRSSFMIHFCLWQDLK